MSERYLQNSLHQHTESQNSIYFINDPKGTQETLTAEKFLSEGAL